jgi:hypothetical protein
MAEEPRAATARLTPAMPPPEALGVSVPRPAVPVDWTAVRVRLDRLGATQFGLEKLTTGGYSFHFRLPSADPTKPRAIEGRAATEAEAVQRAMEQVDSLTVAGR